MRSPDVHQLKIWPKYYAKVFNGTKTFEVRDATDRFFAEGDIVELREWDPVESVFTNTAPVLRFKIGYVLPIDEKRVVFSLLPIGVES